MGTHRMATTLTIGNHDVYLEGKELNCHIYYGQGALVEYTASLLWHKRISSCNVFGFLPKLPRTGSSEFPYNSKSL